MTTSSRVVRKSLACEEDILLGKGTVVQSRNGADYELTKLRHITPVDTIEERDALDTTKHLYCTVAGTPYMWDGNVWVVQSEITVASTVELKTSNLLVGTVVHTAGYHAAGDGGHGIYLVVPPQSVDGYGDLLAANGNALILFKGSTVDIRQYGVSTANANNQPYIQAAFEAAKHGAFELLANANEVYNFTSDVQVTGASCFTLTGNAVFAGASAGVYIHGALVEVGTVSSSASVDDTEITLDTAGDFAQGDVAVIWNSTDYSLSPHRSNYYDGEFSRIREVTGTVLTLEQPLLSSYAAAGTNKVFKLEGVKATINGCSFVGGSLYALQIRYGEHCKIAPDYCESTAVGMSAALSINRCYESEVTGGRYFRHDGGATSGTDYGIGIINSQAIVIQDVESYARRHAVSVGGDANDGAVPCRYIHVVHSTLTNDPAASTYNADFHGNTIDSYYEDCVINGCIGLAGENIAAKNCKVHAFATNDAPLTYHELVGGKLEFLDCTVTMADGNTAIAVVNNAGSELTANITKPYQVYIRGLDAELTAAITTIVNAFENSGQPNVWYIEDFGVRGDLGTYSSIIKVSLSGVGITPSRLSVVLPRYVVPVSYLSGSVAGAVIKLPSSAGSNANGEFVQHEDGTMTCTFNYSASLPISSAFLGGFRTTGITWDYPVPFVSAPIVTITPDEATAFSGLISSAANVNSLLFFLTAITSQPDANRSAHLVAHGRWY